MLAQQQQQRLMGASPRTYATMRRPPSLLLGGGRLSVPSCSSSIADADADARAPLRRRRDRAPPLPPARAAAADPFAPPPSPQTPSTPGPPPSAPDGAGLPQSMQPFGRKTWTWRGHSCSYVAGGCGPSVVLVHGFGASATQYRRLFSTLVGAGYKVYVPDLLGFGASAMPLPEDAAAAAGEPGSRHFYRLELWRDQIADFVAEFCPPAAPPVDESENYEKSAADGKTRTTQTPTTAAARTQASSTGPVLVGNSVGSLACLMAAAGPVNARGVVLLNTAGALNNKGVVSDWRIVLAYPIFLLVDLLLSVEPVARGLFNKVRDPDTLMNVLKAAYGDDEGQGGVDDELVALIAGPAERDNALAVFVDVVTSPHYGPKPWDLVPLLKAKGTPLLVAWGTEDKLTPLDGPVGQYFRTLAAEAEEGKDGGGGGGGGKSGGAAAKAVSFALLEGHGHCPHDDPRPLLAEKLLPWLKTVGGRNGEKEESRQEEAAAAAAV